MLHKVKIDQDIENHKYHVSVNGTDIPLDSCKAIKMPVGIEPGVLPQVELVFYGGEIDFDLLAHLLVTIKHDIYTCPLCGSHLKSSCYPSDDICEIECERCGKLQISREAKKS